MTDDGATGNDGTGDDGTGDDGTGDDGTGDDGTGDDDPAPAVPEGLQVVLVAAVAENGVIGADGELPWHYPEDLEHFRETTMGHPVIVGRRTYESIVERLGEPLPGRTNVVLTSRDLDLPEGAVAAGSVEEALERACETGSDVAFVAGGASVYEQFLPLADRMAITEIHEAHDGDTTFPGYDPDEWTEVDRDAREELSFVVYRRRAGRP